MASGQLNDLDEDVSLDLVVQFEARTEVLRHQRGISTSRVPSMIESRGGRSIYVLIDSRSYIIFLTLFRGRRGASQVTELAALK